MTFTRKMRTSGNMAILGLSFLGLTAIFKGYREPREGVIMELVHSSQATVIYYVPTMFSFISPSF